MVHVHWAEGWAEVLAAGSWGVGVGSRSMMDRISDPDAIEKFS